MSAPKIPDAGRHRRPQVVVRGEAEPVVVGIGWERQREARVIPQY
jgi:hypothetical protein